MPSFSSQSWIWICALAWVATTTLAQDGEFLDYYEDLDGEDLPEDYKELYDYYNYYNENDDLDATGSNSNGRSDPTDDVGEGTHHTGGSSWDSFGSERHFGGDERIEAAAEDIRRYGPASAENRKSEDNDKDNEENNKSDAEWRRELVYKTYREQLEAYNKLIREEHSARYSTKASTTTTTTITTPTTTTPPPPGNSKSEDPKACRDNDSRCERWGLNGWCALWKPITQVYCKKTCGFCEGMTAPCTDDADVAPYCKSWKSNGDCEADYDYMYQRCPSTCGFCDEDGIKISKRR